MATRSTTRCLAKLGVGFVAGYRFARKIHGISLEEARKSGYWHAIEEAIRKRLLFAYVLNEKVYISLPTEIPHGANVLKAIPNDSLPGMEAYIKEHYVCSPFEYFPPEKKTERLRKAFEEWMAYRRERRLPQYSQSSAKLLAQQLANFSEEEIIESIRRSIANCWNGLFPRRTLASAKQLLEEVRRKIANHPANPDSVNFRFGKIPTHLRIEYARLKQQEAALEKEIRSVAQSR